MVFSTFIVFINFYRSAASEDKSTRNKQTSKYTQIHTYLYKKINTGETLGNHTDSKVMSQKPEINENQ